MSTPCVHIPRLNDPPSLTLPGGMSIEHMRLLDIVQPALTPLMPVFDIIDAVVAAFNCIQAIPAAFGPPPDPTAIAASIPELGEKVTKLLQLIPQLSLPMTIVGIIDLVISELQKARAEFVHLQSQLTQLTSAIERAAELEDAELEAITNCARENIASEAAHVGKQLASLGKLMGILALFMGMIGGPEIPDLSSLDGQTLDQVIAPLDALVEQLQAVRSAVPIP